MTEREQLARVKPERNAGSWAAFRLPVNLALFRSVDLR